MQSQYTKHPLATCMKLKKFQEVENERRGRERNLRRCDTTLGFGTI